MLNFLAWIVAGGLLGCLASRMLSAHTTPATLLNILAGMVGGFVSGLVVKTLLFALDPHMARLSLWALASALIGASLALVVINLPARGRTAR